MSARLASSSFDLTAASIEAACARVVAGKLAMRAIAAWAEPLNLSEAEFRLLWLLYQRSPENAVDAAPLDQAELAERLAVSPGQISGVVERLQARQLIACSVDGADRRRQLWRLADGGAELIAKAAASVQGFLQQEQSCSPPSTTREAA